VYAPYATCMATPLCDVKPSQLDLHEWLWPGQIVEERGGEDDDDVSSSGGVREAAWRVQWTTHTAVAVDRHQHDHPVRQRLKHAQPLTSHHQP